MTVLTRAVLNSDADTSLADNTSGEISPADIRQRIKDIADSAVLAEDGYLTLEQFGAVGDGTTDDSTAINAALTYVKTNGGMVRAGPKTYRCRNITLGGGAKPWGMIGAGKLATIFEHLDGNGTLFNGAASSVGYTLGGFTVDCKHSVYNHANANNGITVLDTSNVQLVDIRVQDYKVDPVLIYATTPGTHEKCSMVNVECDGGGVGANGLLFADIDHAHYENCRATGVVFVTDVGPGIGLQFKNECRWPSAVNLSAEDCFCGFSAGADSGDGPSWLQITGLRATGCDTGVRLKTQNSNLLGVTVDMEDGTAGDAIDFQDGAVGNVVTGAVVLNVGAGKRASLFRDGATDNYVEIAHLNNINTTGTVGRFDDGAERNRIRLRRMSDPVMRSAGLQSMISFGGSGPDGNSFSYDDYPAREEITIASGVVTLRNAATRYLRLDTESSASSDDLDTITAYAVDGAMLTLYAAHNERDVVVKHATGNIDLIAGTDTTLSDRTMSVTLRYSALESKWCEV